MRNEQGPANEIEWIKSFLDLNRTIYALFFMRYMSIIYHLPIFLMRRLNLFIGSDIILFSASLRFPFVIADLLFIIAYMFVQSSVSIETSNS